MRSVLRDFQQLQQAAALVRASQSAGVYQAFHPTLRSWQDCLSFLGASSSSSRELHTSSHDQQDYISLNSLLDNPGSRQQVGSAPISDRPSSHRACSLVLPVQGRATFDRSAGQTPGERYWVWPWKDSRTGTQRTKSTHRLQPFKVSASGSKEGKAKLLLLKHCTTSRH